MNRKNQSKAPDDASCLGDDGDDPLDDLLALAKWPTPTAHQLQRVQGHWEQIRQADANIPRPVLSGWRWRIPRGLLTAAALLGWLVAGVFGWRLYQIDQNHVNGLQPGHTVSVEEASSRKQLTPRQDSPRGEKNNANVNPEAPAPKGLPPQNHPAVAIEPDALVSSPSPFQQVVFIAHHPARRKKSKPPSAPPAIDLLVEALKKLNNQPQAEISSLASRLLEDRENHEHRLLKMLREKPDEPLPAPRRDIVRLLRLIGGPRAVPTLIPLLQHTDKDLRLEARITLQTLADSATLVHLANAETKEALQREWLAELLRRSSFTDIQFYLRALTSPRTQSAAAMAMSEVDDPPVQSLYQLMNSPLQGQRIAAAKALGLTNRPQATARLVLLVQQNVYRYEALMGLLCSREIHAQQFLAQIRADRRLSAVLHAAHVRLQAL